MLNYVFKASKQGVYTKKTDSGNKSWAHVSAMLFGYLWFHLHYIITFIHLPIHQITSNSAKISHPHYRQDTVKLCNIFSSSIGLKKDNGFLYLLSFPSLIESQTKVKHHKGFFVSYKKHLSKHIVHGHAGAINNPLRPASHRLVQV